MSQLVCQSRALPVFIIHRVQPLIRAGLFGVKLLHPLVTSPDRFIVLSDFCVRCGFLFEVFISGDAAGCVLLIEPELHALELFGLRLQITDFIRTLLDSSLSEIANLTVLNGLLFSQHKELTNRVIGCCLKSDLAVLLANRTLCIAVMCGVMALIIGTSAFALASGQPHPDGETDPQTVHHSSS